MGMEKIEKIPIIERLKTHTEYYQSFSSLVNDYSKELDFGAPMREVGFTPHDFSHHCKDIYEILSVILPEPFYTSYPNGSNLFLLLTSVLFHDIAMTLQSDASSRRKHSETGKKYVLEEILGKEDTSLKRNYKRELATALGDVIYAHSDIKDDAGDIIHYSFLEILNKYKDEFMNVNNEQINVPLIAALLRLADELDITFHRVDGTNYNKKHNSDDSRIHYEICDYIETVCVPDNSHSIKISSFEYKFETTPEADKPTIAGLILDKYIKIKSEFDVLYDKVLSSNKYAPNGIWQIETVELKDEQKFREYVKKKLS